MHPRQIRRTKEQSRIYKSRALLKLGEERKERQRKYGLMHAYGLSVAAYDQMHEAQKGLCAICKKPETAKFKGVQKRLAVDHCHATGNVRGLLCTGCNILLGSSKDSPEVLRAAIAYLCGRPPHLDGDSSDRV